MAWQTGKIKNTKYKTQCFQWATKPISRVLYLTIIYLGLLFPIGSSDTPEGGTGRPCILPKQSASLPIRSCSKWGLHSRKVAIALVSSYLAFPPLPNQIALSLAVYLCCTFLKVAFTGSYPAPCPVELGLSSPELCQQRLSGLLARLIISH